MYIRHQYSYDLIFFISIIVINRYNYLNIFYVVVELYIDIMLMKLLVISF